MLIGILSLASHCALWQFDEPITTTNINTCIDVLAREGFGPYTDKEREAVAKIIWKESSNRPWARSKVSTAFGLFGGLRMTYQGYGFKYGDECVICQFRFGLTYIESRYGSPTKALAFHNRKGWY